MFDRLNKSGKTVGTPEFLVVGLGNTPSQGTIRAFCASMSLPRSTASK